jgi:hypothetical protein
MLTFRHYRLRDPDTNEVYLERWSLNFGLFSIKLHHIWREDFGRDLHDHPWWFVSLILRGGYVERLWREGRERTRTFHRWRLLRRSTPDRHRIERVLGPTWSLVITGPSVREWGFWVDNYWIPHTRYRATGNVDEPYSRGHVRNVRWERPSDEEQEKIRAFQEDMYRKIREARVLSGDWKPDLPTEEERRRYDDVL